MIKLLTNVPNVGEKLHEILNSFLTDFSVTGRVPWLRALKRFCSDCKPLFAEDMVWSNPYYSCPHKNCNEKFSQSNFFKHLFQPPEKCHPMSRVATFPVTNVKSDYQAEALINLPLEVKISDVSQKLFEARERIDKISGEMMELGQEKTLVEKLKLHQSSQV